MPVVEQGKKNKKYFWVPAIAPLISVILSTFFVFIFHAEKHDVQIVSVDIKNCSVIILMLPVYDFSLLVSYIRYCNIKVRHINRGINPPSVKEIYFSGEYLSKGFRIGAIAGLIALTVSYAPNSSFLGRSFFEEKLILYITNFLKL